MGPKIFIQNKQRIENIEMFLFKKVDHEGLLRARIYKVERFLNQNYPDQIPQLIKEQITMAEQTPGTKLSSEDRIKNLESFLFKTMNYNPVTGGNVVLESRAADKKKRQAADKKK